MDALELINEDYLYFSTHIPVLCFIQYLCETVMHILV